VQVGRQATTGEIVKAGKHQKGRLPKSGGDAPDDRAPPIQRAPACPLRPSVDGSPRIPPEIDVELGIRAPQASALPPPEGVTTRACGRSSPRERLRPAAALAASSMARLRSPRSPRSTRRCAWILPLVSAPPVVMSRGGVPPVDPRLFAMSCRPRNTISLAPRSCVTLFIIVDDLRNHSRRAISGTSSDWCEQKAHETRT